MQHIGELAAFGTAVCWTLSALYFERASKRIGVLAVNFFKVVFAAVFLTVTAGVMRGMPLPLDAPRDAWIFLSLSGLVGFVVADIFLFSAYVTIGSRLSTLFLALSPPLTAVLGYVFLGEAMGTRSLLGMALVAAGIVLAVLGRGDHAPVEVPAPGAKPAPHPRVGFLYAFLSSIGQSVGMILTKRGLGSYDPVSGTQIRVFVAVVGFAIVSLAWQRGRNLSAAVKDRDAMKTTFGGAVFGPFIGVTLSLFAMQRTHAGIVSTLIGLTPILIIPPYVIFFKQKVRPLEIAGAVLAVAGSAVFFL